MRLIQKWKGLTAVKLAGFPNKLLHTSEIFLGTSRCVGLRKQLKTLKLIPATCQGSPKMECPTLTESLSLQQMRLSSWQHQTAKCSILNSLASSKLLKRLLLQTLQLGAQIRMCTPVKISETSDKNFSHS